MFSGGFDRLEAYPTTFFHSLRASIIAEGGDPNHCAARSNCASLTEQTKRWEVIGYKLTARRGILEVMTDVTHILAEIEHGDPHAVEQLLPLVYNELRQLAAQRLAQEKPGQTLQATALVHEAYLRLVDVDKSQYWRNRGHFFAAAAEAMRRILVEEARRKKSIKSGGAMRRIDLNDAAITLSPEPDDLLALDDAIAKLAREDVPAAEIARLRLFAGLSLDDAATSLGLSHTTAFRHWTYARAFLQHEMRSNDR
jgi:RNA polymerase sigma factor (TIGR02999 family)